MPSQFFPLSHYLCCQRGCLQAPRLASPWCSDWGTPLPVPPSHYAPPSTGLGQKVPSPGIMVAKQLLCLKSCFLATAVAELGDWQADLRGRRAGEVKIPRKRTLLSLQISGWWISRLQSHDYYILLGTSCFSKSGPVAGWIVPWTQGRIKEMRVPDLPAVLGDLWCMILYGLGEPWSAGQAVIKLNWGGMEGGNNFLKAKHHRLLASLSACWWGLCLFFSSSAQTQLHCSVTWGICALLPARLHGAAPIPPEPKQHLRWGKFPNLFSRLKKAAVPFGAVLLWGLAALPLCSVKENGKSGKAFENRRFLPFPPVDKTTQPELRRLPAPGTELPPPVTIYRGRRCDSGTTFCRPQRHCRGESHTK